MSLDILKMKYAFAFCFVKRIVWADEILVESEKAYIEEWFPKTLFYALGLHTQEDLDRYYQLAYTRISSLLSKDEKKEVFGLLLGACVADDYLDFREFSILDEAAKLLEISNQHMFELMEYFLEANMTTFGASLVEP